MIVANLATYPPRAHYLPRVVKAIAPQVDRLNLVFNEYDRVPGFVADYPSVVPIIPDHDTKDAGKFYPDTAGAEYVFLVDDDNVYPADFVALTVTRMRALGTLRAMGGYHSSIYQSPPLAPTVPAAKRFLRFHLRPRQIANFRDIVHFGRGHDDYIHVDQVATNAAVIRGDLIPGYDDMRTSQKFVDVRLAKWCFEQGILRLSLPRKADWILPSEAEGVSFDETIVHGFTYKHHAHVAREIWSYAFRSPRVGKALDLKTGT
jgi:hypothetical protein